MIDNPKDLCYTKKNTTDGGWISMDKSVIRYVKEIQDGNDQAFNDLYESIYDDVFRMACSALHNQADASDVTQEVFIAIYKNIHLLKEVEAFPLWVQRIVFTRCTRLFRKRKESLMNENHVRTLSYEAEKDKDFLPKEKFDDEREQELMRQMVSKLQPKHQEVISCVYFQEMSLKETADYLQRPEGTIKSQLFAARKELYGYIKDYERKNQRKINFYDWGTPATTGLFSWARFKAQWNLIKSGMKFWQTIMISSSMVMTIACAGIGVNIYHISENQQVTNSDMDSQPKQQKKISGQIIMGRMINTPQDAYFALMDWGGTPEYAATKDISEINEMRKAVDILAKVRGIYWERFQREGWMSVFE